MKKIIAADKNYKRSNTFWCLMDIVFDFVYFFKTNSFLFNKLDRLESISFQKARKRILSALCFLEGKYFSNKELPWLKKNCTRFEYLKIRAAYIKCKWIAYGSHNAFFDGDYERYYNWDILTLYPDFPLPSFFDFNRLIEFFPEKIKKEYAEQKDKSCPTFGSKKAPYLGEILKKATELQSEWVSCLFVQPIVKKENNIDYYTSLYDFSGNLISILMVIFELINSINTGLLFSKEYSLKLMKYINLFFDKISKSNAAIADLIFLHCAVWKLWFNINGMRGDRMVSPLINTFRSPAISNYGRKTTIIDILKTFLLKNPFSNLMLIDFLADTKLLNTETKEPFPQIGWLFKTNIEDEILFWLANYTFTGLMSDPPQAYPSCLGTNIPSEPQQIFQNRIYCLGKLLSSVNDELKDDVKAKKKYLRFCVYFYDMLLKEWHKGITGKRCHVYPFLMIDRAIIPEEIRLSHFSIEKSEDVQGIIKAINEGQSFSQFAKKHSANYLVRHSGGDRGWIGQDQLPLNQEQAVFSFPIEKKAFGIEFGDKYHIFYIHERKFSKTTTLFDQIREWIDKEKGDFLKNAYISLFSILEGIFKDGTFETIEKIDKHEFKRLSKKTLFYQRIIGYCDKFIEN